MENNPRMEVAGSSPGGICKFCGNKANDRQNPPKCESNRSPNGLCNIFFPVSMSEFRRLDVMIGAKN